MRVLLAAYRKLHVVSLFHNDFSPSGEQPEHRTFAHES